MIVILALLLIALGTCIHLLKKQINEFLDLYAPLWYPTCEFCRGVHFGALLGIIIGVILMLWLN